MSLSVLHFANLRLGAAYPSLGMRGRDLRAQLLASLKALGGLAVERKVDAVLVSGDLFGCAVPATATLKAVQAFFAHLRDAGIAAVILPGARDPEGAFDSTFQADARDLFPGAHVLGPDMPCAKLDKPDFDVYSVLLPAGASDVITALVPVHTVPPRLAIGVGYWPGKAQPDLAAMAEAAAAIGLRYLGVGGSPAFDTGPSAGTVACSPGVPEPVDWDHANGTAALVGFDEEGHCSVDRLATGILRFARKKISLTPDNKHPLSHILDKMSDPHLGLEIVLTGVCPSDTSIDPALLEAEYGDKFFSLRVVDRTKLQIDAGSAASESQATVLGNFARIMDARIKSSAGGEEAALQREAYRLAVHLLQGGQATR